MSLTVDTAGTARINSQARGATYLVEMDFGTGTIRYTMAPLNFTIGGNVFTGLYNLTSISKLSESETNSAEKVTLSFSIVNQAMLAASIGNVENYRGKAVRIYLQLMTPQFQPDGAPIRRWSGYMNAVAITRTRSDPNGGGASTGKIEMTCTRAGMPQARNYQGLRISLAQQQSVYPNDTGLEYLQALIETPALWLSKLEQTQT